MRTFEFKDGKSNKFWNIDLAGTSFTVTYGRIGTEGQTQTKEFASDDKARAAHDKLVAEKLGKGYVETSAGKPAAPSSGKALENAILANPDDLGAHAAYADWLIEQGDPRGEFIQVQLALEDEKKPAAERNELQKREKELLKKHEREWLGELAPYLAPGTVTDHQFQFARGWLDTIHIGELTVEFSRALAKAAAARAVRRLEIVETAYEEEGEFEEGDDIPEGTENPGLYPLLKSNGLTNVRVFQLGEPYEDSRWGGSSCHTNGAIAVDLVKKMPRLQELYLLAHGVDTDALFALKSLTELRILHVNHLNHYPLEKLARNAALGRLTQLLLHPHGLDDDEAYIRLPGLRAVVRSPHLASLTHLHVRLADVGDAGCTEIVDSGVLKRLKVLELTHGCITDEGAQILARCPDSRRLDLLNLSYNALSATGIKALKALGIAVKTDEQHTQEEIDDRVYLYEGDPE